LKSRNQFFGARLLTWRRNIKLNSLFSNGNLFYFSKNRERVCVQIMYFYKLTKRRRKISFFRCFSTLWWLFLVVFKGCTLWGCFWQPFWWLLLVCFEKIFFIYFEINVMSGSIVEMCPLLHFSRLLKVIKIKIQLIINIITLVTMVFLFGV
jgi:hypothetical protein